MRVLIVDDQLHVVNGIAVGIDWDKLGVTETLCAHSAFEARQIFSEHPVDVMLCDIEMPVESVQNQIASFLTVSQRELGLSDA